MHKCANSTTITPTSHLMSSSGVCCEDGSQSENAEDDSEDEDAVDSPQLLPGMNVLAVAEYNSGDPTHLQLRRGDVLLLLQQNHSPPTIANQKLLLGRRCADAKEGLFPTCCVEKVKARVEGRREQKYGSTTLPSRGRSSSRSSALQNQMSISNSSTGTNSSLGLFHKKTVELQRGEKGFGFVLRGVKATSPLMSSPQNQSLIGLQYLDEVEAGGIAELAGLRRGEFLLAVNGQDVSQASHEVVVQMIRKSGDTVTMTVASSIRMQSAAGENAREKAVDDQENRPQNGEGSDSQLSQSLSSSHASQAQKKFSTLPRNVASNVLSTGRSASRGRVPPPPPKRDPTTTLSIGRAGGRSLILSSSSTSTSTTNPSTRSGVVPGNEYDSEGRSTKSSSPTTSIESIVISQRNGNVNDSKVASIRGRPSRRISAFELEEFFARQSSDGSSHGGSSKAFQSVAALKKKRKKRLHKNFNSTPDLQEQLQQLQKSQCSNSQEDLRAIYYYPQVCTETLSLRGGKIVSSNEQSTTFGKSQASRAPPPSHPPPPPPENQTITTVVRLELSKPRTDYVNMDTVSQQQMLSSFRPQETDLDCKSHQEVTVEHKVLKAPAPLPGSGQQKSNLRPAKQLTTGTISTSIYTRQDTTESLDESLQPTIPEPDYSSGDEEIRQNKELSTFRSTATTGNSHCIDTPVTTASKNCVENQAKTNDALNFKVQANKSDANVEKTELIPNTTSAANDEEEDKNQDGVSKVKQNIREFERRSSVCGEGGNNTATSVKKQESLSSEQSALRMSKSCFEVDFCNENVALNQHVEDRSKEVKSVEDRSKEAKCAQLSSSSPQQMQQNEMQSAQIQSANRRNSAAVSEKIANLIAATQTQPQQQQQQLQQTQQNHNVSLQKNLLPQQQFLQKRSSTSSNEDKTPASALKPINTSAQAVITTKPIQQQNIKTVTFSLTSVKTEPITNATQSSVKNTTASLRKIETVPSKQSAIQLQIDSLGLAAVNEVDVLAELVPPPPEFAAPPQPGQLLPEVQRNREQHATQLTPEQRQQQLMAVQRHQHQLYLAQQQHRQQLMHDQRLHDQHLQKQQQARLQQIQQQKLQQARLKQQLSDSSQPQLNQQTLQHLRQIQNREQIRILSPQPVQMVHSQHQRSSSTPPPPPAEFCDLLHQQHHHHHSLQQQQKISAAMRLGISNQQQQQNQQFATLTRSSAKPQQSQLQQQQFATLSRVPYGAKSSPQQSPVQHQQQHLATMTRAQKQQYQQQQYSNTNYSDFTRLTVQNRLMRQQQPSPQPQTIHQAQQMQQLQKMQQQHHSHQQPPFLRRPISDWTSEDVSDWLLCIGMGEHKNKLEYFNGAKLLRIDNNALLGIGVRQQQHRIYILEKLKLQHQHWQHHQHH